MNVTHVIAGLARADGGPSYSVPALCAGLVERCAAVRIRFVAQGDRDVAKVDARVDLIGHAGGPWPGSLLKGSPSLRAAVEDDARSGAILHGHGLWLLPNLYPAWAKARWPEAKVVYSPRGMLAPAAMAISAWKKKPVWHLWQRAALERADCLHATAESEYREIRSAGLRNPVCVIPNGIDLSPPDDGVADRPAGPRTLLSLGRIHPKKALDVLVKAWARLEATHSDWSVRIVGPSEGGHAEDLTALARSLGLSRLSVEGPVYGGDKVAAYRSASLFVLPTLNENFGISVAEALAAEVPVISSKGAPWAGLEREGCGWWIDHGVDPLVATLEAAMALDGDVLAGMGRRGRAWMARDFGWPRVAEDMQAVYEWLQGREPIPSCVRMD